MVFGKKKAKKQVKVEAPVVKKVAKKVTVSCKHCGAADVKGLCKNCGKPQERR